MATNPMQRKARNSFLLGMLLMLIISGAVIALLFMQLMKKNQEEKEELATSKQVYVLNQDVSSGQVITQDMLTPQTLPMSLIPSNATGDSNFVSNYSLQDKEGNDIYTKTSVNNQTNETESKLYIRRNNNEYEVHREEATDSYYINTTNNSDEKEYLELTNVPLVAKVTMKANTIITSELVSKSDNLVQDDVRKQEYNMLVLPIDIQTGDYVDVRLMLPSGQDYIVVAKKEVEVPIIAGVDSEDTIWMNLSEDEILHMSCAIIDAYQISGSKLYVTKYTEAGMQNAATPTYPINRATSELLQSDPNILEKAMTELNARYNENNLANLRNNYINAAIESEGDQAQSNIETNMQESITNSQNSRKEYLQGLSAPEETTTAQ